MSEADAIALSTSGPVTKDQLVCDLMALGIKPGMLLMTHASLSQLGWVVGGAVTVVRALREVLGTGGTMVMPAFSWDNSEPRKWKNPPVPESWWPIIREHMPAYQRHTPVREMGRIAEYLISLPDVTRSQHPACSWVAQGPLQHAICDGHTLEFTLGEHSPLARCYEHNGYVLSLGCTRTTILHLAEHRAAWYGRTPYAAYCAMVIDGRREWVEYREMHGDCSDFEQLRQAFMRDMARGDYWNECKVGYGQARLFAVRPLVDYAVKWIEANRPRTNRNAAPPV